MHQTVYHALLDTARRHVDAPALSFGDLTYSYSKLIEQVDAMAAGLARRGVGFGTAFAVYAQNCLEIMFCYYAAAKLGAVIVPINPNMTASEVRYIVDHCDAQLLLHDEATASTTEAVLSAEKRHQFREVLTEALGASILASEERVSREDEFLVIYTSGSTGSPKAVVLNHAAQVEVCEALIEMWCMTAQDVTLVALPLGYLYGLSTAAAVGLRAGGHVVVLPKFRPGDVIDALIQRAATVFHGVPTMFTMMLEFAEQNRVAVDLSGTRQMISAGAHMPDEIVDRFYRRFHKKVNNYYAMTECTPVFGVYASDSAPIPRGAIGKLAPKTRFRIVNTEGKECGPGEEGELHVQGAATLTCYLKDPELTGDSLQDGWFKTGDLAKFDAEGYFYLTGRIKDIIIRGGAKIAPAEVERVLSSHESVQAVAVIGVPDRVFGEVPAAFVVKRAGCDATSADLIQHAESQLADFKIPRQYRFVDSFPIGITGKVDKKALKALWGTSR